MPIFWRDGYLRRSKCGVLHDVAGHWVNRAATCPSYIDPILERFPELTHTRVTAVRFITPNAKCPVCRNPVWYFQNEHGSRVFFDNIGWPWPKHPCTDSTMDPDCDNRGKCEIVTPIPRTADEIAEIQAWLKLRGTNRTSCWEYAMVVNRVYPGLFVLELVRNGQKKVVKCESLRKVGLQSGYLVSLAKRKMSFFELESMEVKEAQIRCLRGRALVDELSNSRRSK